MSTIIVNSMFLYYFPLLRRNTVLIAHITITSTQKYKIYILQVYIYIRQYEIQKKTLHAVASSAGLERSPLA